MGRAQQHRTRNARLRLGISFTFRPLRYIRNVVSSRPGRTDRKHPCQNLNYCATVLPGASNSLASKLGSHVGRLRTVAPPAGRAAFRGSPEIHLRTNSGVEFPVIVRCCHLKGSARLCPAAQGTSALPPSGDYICVPAAAGLHHTFPLLPSDITCFTAYVRLHLLPAVPLGLNPPRDLLPPGFVSRTVSRMALHQHRISARKSVKTIKWGGPVAAAVAADTIDGLGLDQPARLLVAQVRAADLSLLLRTAYLLPSLVVSVPPCAPQRCQLSGAKP